VKRVIAANSRIVQDAEKLPPFLAANGFEAVEWPFDNVNYLHEEGCLDCLTRAIASAPDLPVCYYAQLAEYERGHRDEVFALSLALRK